MSNDDSELTKRPALGDEVVVILTPNIKTDRKWAQLGKLLATRREPFGIIGTVEITGALAAEENPHGWLTEWQGCVVAAVFNKYCNTWQATCPICDRAKAVWARCWETDCTSDEHEH
jgi:hypothetical protein